ncbi:MAG: hypothetical protein SGI83_11115 [Bacteroidota bacterium]|nr:hypothetical protein [Bacteroidota bacterium]
MNSFISSTIILDQMVVKYKHQHLDLASASSQQAGALQLLTITSNPKTIVKQVYNYLSRQKENKEKLNKLFLKT